MKIGNIRAHYKKKIPEKYNYISSRLCKGEGIEEKASIYTGLCTEVFFFIGMTYDMGYYAFSGIYLLMILNFLALAIYVLSAVFYLWEKLSISGLLAILLFTVQANVAVSIVYNCVIMVGDNNSFVIYHDLFIGFLVCMLGALTLKNKMVYILCIMPLICLVIALALRSPIALVQHFPSLCLAYVSPPVFLARIRVFLFETIRRKEQLIKERQSLYRMMGMNEQQWDLMIEVIQAPHTPRDKTQQIFDMMQEAISNQLMMRAKQLLVDEKAIGKINEKQRLNLSGNEIYLCTLILEDKSIADISRILYISESTVRANRSRLRKKLGLSPKDNLKAHLLKLVGEENPDI